MVYDIQCYLMTALERLMLDIAHEMVSRKNNHYKDYSKTIRDKNWGDTVTITIEFKKDKKA